MPPHADTLPADMLEMPRLTRRVNMVEVVDYELNSEKLASSQRVVEAGAEEEVDRIDAQARDLAVRSSEDDIKLERDLANFGGVIMLPATFGLGGVAWLMPTFDKAEGQFFDWSMYGIGAVSIGLGVCALKMLHNTRREKLPRMRRRLDVIKGFVAYELPADAVAPDAEA